MKRESTITCPGASKGFLASVSPQMSFKMRWLGVNLFAVGISARKDLVIFFNRFSYITIDAFHNSSDLCIAVNGLDCLLERTRLDKKRPTTAGSTRFAGLDWNSHGFLLLLLLLMDGLQRRWLKRQRIIPFGFTIVHLERYQKWILSLKYRNSLKVVHLIRLNFPVQFYEIFSVRPLNVILISIEWGPLLLRTDWRNFSAGWIGIEQQIIQQRQSRWIEKIIQIIIIVCCSVALI